MSLPAEANSSGGSEQWRIFLGLALIIPSYIFRVEIVRFTLRIFRRILPRLFVWIKEFEKQLLRPLSWVVFVLLVWLCTWIMDLSGMLNVESSAINGIVVVLLGFPLVWVVISFCNYVTWVSRKLHQFSKK